MTGGSLNGVAFSVGAQSTCAAGFVNVALPATAPALTQLLPLQAIQQTFLPSPPYTDTITACAPMTDFVQLTGVTSTTQGLTVSLGNIALGPNAPPTLVTTVQAGSGNTSSGFTQVIGANIAGGLSTAVVSAINYIPGGAGGPAGGAGGPFPWLSKGTTVFKSGDQLTLTVNSNAIFLDPGTYQATFTVTPSVGDNAGVPIPVVVTLTISSAILPNTTFGGGTGVTNLTYSLQEGNGFTDNNCGGGGPCATETINIPVVSSVNLLTPSQGDILLNTTGLADTCPASVLSCATAFPVLGVTGAYINLTPTNNLPVGAVGCGQTGDSGVAMSIGTAACYIQVVIPANAFSNAPFGSYTGSFALTAVSPNFPAGAPVTAAEVPNTSAIKITINATPGDLFITTTPGTNPPTANFGVPTNFTGLINSTPNGVTLNAQSMATTTVGTFTATYTPGGVTCPAVTGVTGSTPALPAASVAFSATGAALPAANQNPPTEPFQVGIQNTATLSPGIYGGSISIQPIGPQISAANNNNLPAVLTICAQVGVQVFESYNNLSSPIFFEAGTTQNSTFTVAASGIWPGSTVGALTAPEFGTPLPLGDPALAVTLTGNVATGVSFPTAASSTKTPSSLAVLIALQQQTTVSNTQSCANAFPAFPPSPNDLWLVGSLVTGAQECPSVTVALGNSNPAGAAFTTPNPEQLPIILTSGVELLYEPSTGVIGNVTSPFSEQVPGVGGTVGEHISFNCTYVVGTATPFIDECEPSVTILSSAGTPTVRVTGPFQVTNSCFPAVDAHPHGGQGVSPGNPVTFTFDISAATLCAVTPPVGTYYSSYVIAATNAGPNPPPQYVEVDITLTITANPTVTANPPAISFNYNLGAPATTPASQVFTLLANAVPSPIGFTVSSGSGTASVLLNGGTTVNGCITTAGTLINATISGGGAYVCDPSANPAPLVLTATIATAGLTTPNNVYNGSINVSIPGTNGNVVVEDPLFSIPVTVATFSTPSLTFNPSAEPAFQFTLGQSAETDPASLTSTITLIGTDTYNVTSSVDYVTVTPNASISAATTVVTLAVAPGKADFPTTAGTYPYTITATGVSGETATLMGSIVITGKPVVSFNTPSSPDAIQYYAGDPDSTVSPFTVNVGIVTVPAGNPQNATYTLTATTNQPWCAASNPGAVNNSGGTMTVTLTPLEAVLVPSATPYVCTVTVAGGASITTGTFVINLTVSAQSLNAPNPNTLTFNMPTNATPATSSQTVPLTGHGTFTFNTTDAVVSPVGGTWLSSSAVNLVKGAGTLTVTTNDTGLAAGNQYGGTIAYIGPPSNSVPFNTTVYLNVGVIGASPTSVTFSHTLNYTTPQPATVQLTSPPANLGFTVVTTPSASWLTCSANTNVTPAVLTVSYSATGLTAANSPYTGSCTVNTTGSSNTLVIPVTLNVTASPTLSATIGGGNNPVINLTGTLGGSNVTSTVTIDANGLPAGGTIPFTVTNVTSNPQWLSVSPLTGTVGSTGSTVTITVNMAALGANSQPGTLNGYFNIGSADSANTLTVSVILTTVAPGDPFFNGELSVGGGFFYLVMQDGSPFGFYSFAQGTANSPTATIFHADMGFEYVIPAGGAGAGVYMYDFSSNHWWYTGSTLFPYIYDFNLNSWLYYFPNASSQGHYTTAPRYFYQFSTGKIVSF